MPKQYNQIKLLVHPLFNPLYDYIMKKISKEECLKIVKINLAQYGKAVLESARNPNTLFILVDPYLEDDLKPKSKVSKEQIAELKSIYDKLIKRFKEFAREQLGDSFVDTNFLPQYQEEYLPERIYSKLGKQVDLEVFGEDGDVCVNHWSEGFLKPILEHKGVGVNLTKNNSRTSFHQFNQFEFSYYKDNLNVRALSAKKSREYRKQLARSPK